MMLTGDDRSRKKDRQVIEGKQTNSVCFLCVCLALFFLFLLVVGKNDYGYFFIVFSKPFLFFLSFLVYYYYFFFRLFGGEEKKKKPDKKQVAYEKTNRKRKEGDWPRALEHGEGKPS